MLRIKQANLYLMVLFMALANNSASIANPTSRAKQGIKATLTKRNQARDRRDLNAYMATFTPNWVTMNVSGKVVNYATLQKSTTAEFAHLPAHVANRVNYTITNVVSNGQMAQITVNAHFNYPVRKMVSGPVYCSKSTVASEVWVMNSAGWQEQSERYLVDDIRFSVHPSPN